jgi:uncharacterized protein with GYD domain
MARNREVRGSLALWLLLTPTETGSIVSFRRAGRDQNRGEGLMGEVVLTKDAAKDEVTYFFLVKRTEKDATEAQKKKARQDINKIIKQEGGKCHLYTTNGASFNFVSVVTGITAAGAIRVAAVIDKPGTVKATLVAGLENFAP